LLTKLFQQHVLTLERMLCSGFK